VLRNLQRARGHDIASASACLERGRAHTRHRELGSNEERVRDYAQQRQEER